MLYIMHLIVHAGVCIKDIHTQEGAAKDDALDSLDGICVDSLPANDYKRICCFKE